MDRLMQRDVDLVRRILLHIERSGADGTSPGGWAPLVEDGYEVSSIQYHIQILHDAGLIQADELVPGQWWPERMTWAGHEFLDASRDEALWNEAKRRVEATVGTAPFEVFRDLLMRMTRERLDQLGPAHSPDSTTEKPAGGG